MRRCDLRSVCGWTCHGAAVLLCIGMSAGGLLPRLHAQDGCTSPDCFNEKIGAVNTHLTATDTRVETNQASINARVDKLDDKLDEIEEEIARLQSGNDTERWAGWAVISLLTGSSYFVKKKKGETP